MFTNSRLEVYRQSISITGKTQTDQEPRPISFYYLDQQLETMVLYQSCRSIVFLKSQKFGQNQNFSGSHKKIRSRLIPQDKFSKSETD